MQNTPEYLGEMYYCTFPNESLNRRPLNPLRRRGDIIYVCVVRALRINHESETAKSRLYRGCINDLLLTPVPLDRGRHGRS